jgi:RNA polymerase sigma factor (sigma-70 family)
MNIYNSGFGDQLSYEQQLEILDDHDRVLAQYHKWLHAVANFMQETWAHPDHDDLVQEGRIAMWKALTTYDPSKGALASWLTTAAKMRMRDCIKREYWTGTPARYGHGGKVPDDGTTVMSLMDDDLTLTAVLEAADLLEAVEISYHRGEILRAIGALSVNQRRYVVYRFWLGWDPNSRQQTGGPSLAEVIGVKHPHILWGQKDRGARDRLREKLLHLESV